MRTETMMTAAAMMKKIAKQVPKRSCGRNPTAVAKDSMPGAALPSCRRGLYVEVSRNKGYWVSVIWLKNADGAE